MKVNSRIIRSLMAGVILTAYSLICISEKKLFYRRFPIEITGITFHVIITIIGWNIFLD